MQSSNGQVPSNAEIDCVNAGCIIGYTVSNKSDGEGQRSNQCQGFILAFRF